MGQETIIHLKTTFSAKCREVGNHAASSHGAGAEDAVTKSLTFSLLSLVLFFNSKKCIKDGKINGSSVQHTDFPVTFSVSKPFELILMQDSARLSVMNIYHIPSSNHHHHHHTLVLNKRSETPHGPSSLPHVHRSFVDQTATPNTSLEMLGSQRQSLSLRIDFQLLYMLSSRSSLANRCCLTVPLAFLKPTLGHFPELLQNSCSFPTNIR